MPLSVGAWPELSTAKGGSQPTAPRKPLGVGERSTTSAVQPSGNVGAVTSAHSKGRELSAFRGKEENVGAPTQLPGLPVNPSKQAQSLRDVEPSALVEKAGHGSQAPLLR